MKNRAALIPKKASRLCSIPPYLPTSDRKSRQLVTTISLVESPEYRRNNARNFSGSARGCDSISGKLRGGPVAMRPSCKDSRGCLRRCLARCLDARSGEFPGENASVETRLHRGKYARAERAADKSETISSDREREKVWVNTEDCSLVKPHE